MSAIRSHSLDARPVSSPSVPARPSLRRERLAPILGALAMVVVIGGFYLSREHFTPAESEWLYLLLLACPLIHLFVQAGSGLPAGSDEAGAHDAATPASLGTQTGVPPPERDAGQRPPMPLPRSPGARTPR